MFNIGFLEIAVIAALGLLFFGPEKLPKAIHTLVVGIRSLKGMANEASSSLQGAAGIDSDTAKKTMSDLAELHPKRWAAGLLTDEPDSTPSTASPKTPPVRAAGDAPGETDVVDLSTEKATDGTSEKAAKPKTVQHRSSAIDLDPDLP